VKTAVLTERIRSKCKEQKKSVKSVLERAGVDNGLIYEWERRGKQPLAETLEAIADALDCSVDYLLGRTDKIERGDAMLLENKNIRKIEETIHKEQAARYFAAGWKLLAVLPIEDKGSARSNFVFAWDGDGEPAKISVSQEPPTRT
jgi:transcriptional regulator with XRE-family HTH domain